MQNFECCVETGIFGCGKEKIKSDLDKFGIGTISYFKTLKSLLIATGIIILLNFILYLIYGLSHPEEVPTSINTALFKNTIGNVATSIIIFEYSIYYFF